MVLLDARNAPVSISDVALLREVDQDEGVAKRVSDDSDPPDGDVERFDDDRSTLRREFRGCVVR